MDKIRISFTGDILAYECQNKLAKIGKDKYDYTDYLLGAKSIFESSNYVVGSLETPLAGRKAKYTCEDTNFNTPDDILYSLKEMGINMLTTGNNHALDRGKKGLIRTLETLDRYGFDHTGTANSKECDSYVVKTIQGVRVAFLSYTYGTNSSVNEQILEDEELYMVNLTRKQDLPPYRSLLKRTIRKVLFSLPKEIRRYIIPNNGYNIISDCVPEYEINSPNNAQFVEKMLVNIANAKAKADVVIFCLHSGGQFNSKVTGYTQWLIDVIAETGVNAIVCNHTHTVLPIERRNNGCVVAYSLGNFSFTPGVGYYIEGVGAEYSKVLHLEISKTKKTIENYYADTLKCVVDNIGKSHVTIV